MVEYLIKWYVTRQSDCPYETVTLSRGYGRQTTGFRMATSADTAATLGDEPLQLYRKFGRQVRVCVGERRADAILTIQQRYPETKLILLDDAFQHRAVEPSLNLLLMDYNRPFYLDYPFPAGRLRESRQGAIRAHAIIVTKCPTNLTSIDRQGIEDRIRPYCRPETPVFFAGLRYGKPVSFGAGGFLDTGQGVVLVSGLANANPLEQYVGSEFSLVKHHRFADHYAYTRADLDRLLPTLTTGEAILTTEKDWVKLDALLTDGERASLPMYYLPVETEFLPGYEAQFVGMLTNAIHKNG